MSSYEDYTRKSEVYDKTREPVGTVISVGALAQSPAPLSEMVLLDAGCGTGNFSQAMLEYVGRIEAVDMNPGMLNVAARKLSKPQEEGRIAFHSAGIDDMPFDDATFDGVMINQVLHHLPDEPSQGFPAHQQVFQELARVLKPGGVLVVNTCSQEQLRHAYWHYYLIPTASDALRSRYAPLEDLTKIISECGFTHNGNFAPLDATVQGEAYFDPRGPLKEDWRDGDSVWSLVSEDELARASAKLQELDENDALETHVARNDARRPDIGQITVLTAIRQ